MKNITTTTQLPVRYIESLNFERFNLLLLLFCEKKMKNITKRCIYTNVTTHTKRMI